MQLLNKHTVGFSNLSSHLASYIESRTFLTMNTFYCTLPRLVMHLAVYRTHRPSFSKMLVGSYSSYFMAHLVFPFKLWIIFLLIIIWMQYVRCISALSMTKVCVKHLKLRAVEFTKFRRQKMSYWSSFWGSSCIFINPRSEKCNWDPWCLHNRWCSDLKLPSILLSG